MMLRLDFWCVFLGTVLTVIINGPATVEPALSLKRKDGARRAAFFRSLEEKFLRKLGFTSRPRPKKGKINEVPKYMLDLYNSRFEDEEWISTDLQFTIHSKPIPSVNTVRSWLHEGKMRLMLL